MPHVCIHYDSIENLLLAYDWYINPPVLCFELSLKMSVGIQLLFH